MGAVSWGDHDASSFFDRLGSTLRLMVGLRFSFGRRRREEEEEEVEEEVERKRVRPRPAQIPCKICDCCAVIQCLFPWS